jgi:RNA polymerase sigma factor (sigma-70 family)
MRATADLTHVIRHLGAPAADDPTDPELLDRYALAHDQAAFAALVRRYGSLVLGVARRQVADRHRAEDVFQATFLALARSAAKLRGQPTVVNWLYTVALRQARKAGARAARREAAERATPPPSRGGGDPLAEITARELLQSIDDELARLPDRLRLPVLLCCVLGQSRGEAARQLRCPGGVVKGRLERGRRLLAARLAARGLAPSALLLAPLASVAVPADILARAAEHAAAPWAETVPAAVAALATATTPHPLLPAAVLAGCVLVAALAGWAGASGEASPVQPAAAQPPAPGPAVNPVPDEPLPAGATRRFGSPRYRHVTEIETLAVSPDGTVAVAASGTKFNGTVRAYDLATGRVRPVFEDVRAEVEAVAFSPDGKTIATRPFPSGGGNSVVYLYDVATGAQTAKVAPGLRIVSDLLLFTPDGKHVLVAARDENAHQVAGRDDSALHLIRLPTGETVRKFPAHTVFAATISPDGKHLVAGGHDYGKGGDWFARRWEVDTGRELAPLPIGKGGIRSVAYSPDGATLAVGGESGTAPTVKLFEAATGRERRRIPVPDPSIVRSVAFSPDGKTLAASAGSSTRLYDPATGEERVTIDRRAIGLRFSPDGKTLVGAVAGAVYRWDAATGRSLIPEGGDSPVGQVAVTADGKRVVSIGYDGDAHIWDARTGEHQRRLKLGWQRDFALSPDGRFLAGAVSDSSIVFDSPTMRGAVHSGSRLRVIDLADGKSVGRFEGFEGSAQNVYFTADGKTLITADRFFPGAAVRVWDVATGQIERSFPALGSPGARVWRSRLSPDGKVLAVMYQKPGRGLRVDYEVKIWDVASGTELGGPTPHWFDPDEVAYSPDGKTVAVVAPDARVQFRDAATGQVRGEFRGPGVRWPWDRATALALGPDGQLYSGTADGTVLAWGARAANLPAGGRE